MINKEYNNKIINNLNKIKRTKTIINNKNSSNSNNNNNHISIFQQEK